MLAQSMKFHGFDKNLNIPLPVVDKQSNPLPIVIFESHFPFDSLSSSC